MSDIVKPALYNKVEELELQLPVVEPFAFKVYDIPSTEPKLLPERITASSNSEIDILSGGVIEILFLTTSGTLPSTTCLSCKYFF